eukprot:TRINITY_DN8669_c0_g1_i3.p2 TRINITY_DN8669_c0_g1~~TRINITY_DN8669_c0_g1_i3.p2  ORF type:complete len:103 (+),score=10.67 TRINITY_DN8669_c0_g1_i3:206-514(+)
MKVEEVGEGCRLRSVFLINMIAVIHICVVQLKIRFMTPGLIVAWWRGVMVDWRWIGVVREGLARIRGLVGVKVLVLILGVGGSVPLTLPDDVGLFRSLGVLF